MTRLLHLLSFCSSILLVLGGDCLTDWNTNQPSSAWNQRLWSYSPNSAAAVSSSSTLTFMSYNLQSSISSACVSNPQTQASFMNTDFVGNQEVVQGVDTRCNCNMPKIIADATGKNTRFVMTFPWRTGQYGVSLGTSQTILDTKYFLYNYANAEQRALVAVKTKPPGLNGKPLWFISTHVDYTVWAARQAEVAQLIQWVKDNIVSQDSTASVVVVGDFNGGPDDAFYGTMKAFFKNAYEVYTGGISGGPTYPANWPSYRFDHCWYYLGSGVSAQIMGSEVINTLASDHRPLKTTIKFTTAATPAPATPAPVTPAPATRAPVTSAPVTPAPATPAPATRAPVTAAPVTAAPVTPAPATKAPVTAAPVTAAPVTAAPVTAAPATAAPPKGATSAPAPTTCSASVSYNTQQNNIVITNTGSKPIKTLELTFSPSVPSNNWNLVATQTSNVYSLPDWAYQSLQASGQKVYTGSGFWTAGAIPTIAVTRVSC